MNEISIRSTGINAYQESATSKKSRPVSEENQPITDKASISEAARLAAEQVKASESAAPTEKFSLWRTFTVAGESFGVETNDSQSRARLTFTDAQGTYSLVMDSSSVLRKGEDGRWAVVKDAVGESRKEDYAKFQKITENGTEEIIYQKETQHVTGSDADDIIILLPQSKHSDFLYEVDAGNGNNVVINLSKQESHINTGSGNDQIASKKALLTVVNSGDGNDIVELEGIGGSVNAGGGDDIVNTNSGFFNVNGGDGNDIIYTEGMTTNIRGGAGNDTIHVRHSMSGVIDGGDGDDTISTDYATNSAIDGGAGNDTIKINHAYNSAIAGSDGNDTIQVNSLINSMLDGGNGDDNISVDHLWSNNADAAIMQARSRYFDALFQQMKEINENREKNKAQTKPDTTPDASLAPADDAPASTAGNVPPSIERKAITTYQKIALLGGLHDHAA